MINSGELFDTFRDEVVDTVATYLWTDVEVARYANEAYVMFVRLIGGIADFTTTVVTQVAVTAGSAAVTLHPKILRIMQCYRASDGKEVLIANNTELETLLKDVDYFELPRLLHSDQQGQIRYLVIGAERGVGQLVMVPAADDSLRLAVYRLPLLDIVDRTHTMAEVGTEHHIHLLDWMKHLAYRKQDADCFNAKASAEGETEFRLYCALAKAEWQRYKHKTRVVRYGGL